MNYAKETNGELQYPTPAEFAGIPNWQQHDYQRRKRGYLPLVGEAEPREGYTARPSRWHIEGDGGTSCIQVDAWSYEPIPPEPTPVVRYSKYRIQLACQSRGLWEQVKAAIAAAGLQDSWANIQDIASDNPELQAALPTISEAFGSDTVDAVLAESIAD